MSHQLSRDDLAGMTPQEIADAHDAGRFDAALGAPEGDVEILDRARHGGGPLTLADISHLARLGRSDLIETARSAGRITL